MACLLRLCWPYIGGDPLSFASHSWRYDSDEWIRVHEVPRQKRVSAVGVDDQATAEIRNTCLVGVMQVVHDSNVFHRVARPRSNGLTQK